jgi:CDP-6-deoxy-D-xylo-4-hexulose-3-dehydrase
MDIPLALDGLSESEIEMVCDIFRSGNLTMGSYVAKFESEFANRFGVKHAVMVNSGSSANLLALEAFVDTLTPQQYSDRSKYSIAVPAVLWPTSLWPVIQLGFRVLLIDTLPNSLEIDLDQLVLAKRELGDRLIGAVLIHPLGKSLDLERIQTIREEFGLFILEDNAESLGSGDNQRFAGTVGDFGTFSFYYSHHITTVEGGMVVTNDDKQADNLRSMRAHGWTRNRMDKNLIQVQFPELPKDFLFVTSGYNFRPMEFQGALGSSQLTQLETFIEMRISNAKRIHEATKNTIFSLIAADSSSTEISETTRGKIIPRPHSWMALPIHCSLGISASQQVQKILTERGISTRPLLAGDFSSQPAGQHPMISSYRDLSNSKALYASSFMVGNHHNYSDEQMNYLSNAFTEVSSAILAEFQVV